MVNFRVRLISFLVIGLTCSIRREVRELMNSDRSGLNGEGQAFVDAVNCLMDSGRWSRLKNVHTKNIAAAHNNAAFLPWHRLYLLALESEMRDCTGQSISVPYWDGTLDSQNPEGSPVFRFFGSNGNNNGPFRANHFSRSFNGGSLPGPEAVQRIESGNNNYDAAREAMEGQYHPYVHSFVGGNMANLYESSGDPLFYLHHAFVDKQWAAWQQNHPSIANDYNGPGPFGGQASRNDVLDMDGVIPDRTVSQMFSISQLGYSYSAGAGPITGGPDPTSVAETSTTSTTSSSVSISSTSTVAVSSTASAALNSTTLLPNSTTTATVLAVSTKIIKPLSSALPTTPNSAALPNVKNVVSNLSKFIKRSFFGMEAELDHVHFQFKKRGAYHGSLDNTVTPACEDRDDEYNLRHVSPLSEHVIKKNGLNETYIRENEKTMNDLVDFLNKERGYLSNAALLYHEGYGKDLLDNYGSITEEQSLKNKKYVQEKINKFYKN
ncbi:hypothetical protein HK099_002417 [Clydaea vesicula]|uniref:Tyrosinase copper-binding domain-containing protein n=1 Tax=Clydaea vesicula TaxID=447962 RepID=A0AAD5UAC9_9FUNG|nr:hypothetical protein HK099_002417 [Clydaea vesicula]